MFDDLFFLGQTAFSVWGLRTRGGIILVDSIFDYSVEAEVIDGLRKLGIDPKEIRYVIISHAHGDHSGGAGFLQQQGARVVMSEADWKLYEQGNDKIKAKRDIVATEGMPIKLGDTTVRVYLTPGHTKGTISTVLPVHDNGKAHTAVLWGGTLFNFRDAADDPRDARLKFYAESAARFREVAKAANADILLLQSHGLRRNHRETAGASEPQGRTAPSVCDRDGCRAALLPRGGGVRGRCADGGAEVAHQLSASADDRRKGWGILSRYKGDFHHGRRSCRPEHLESVDGVLDLALSSRRGRGRHRRRAGRRAGNGRFTGGKNGHECRCAPSHRACARQPRRLHVAGRSLLAQRLLAAAARRQPGIDARAGAL